METTTKYFTRDYIEFFEALERHNNREWFLLNKSNYEHRVNLPFHRFIDDLLGAIKVEDPAIKIQTSDAVFRIQKDMRFNKDGKPYKLFKSALISAKGRKFKEEPGFYLEIGAQYIKMALGCFKLKPSQIKRLEDEMHKIDALTEQVHFKNTFGVLIKEKNSMAFQTILPIHIIDNEGLNELILMYWRMSKPVIDTFKTILNK
ncbi:DUF2461 family protein [Aestuariivivens insulae]|uniref:DUF2461 family protein n=1 Tax=Aestuariivivens insulae TaxID=1621988 RepID=UPI001F596BFF|nr:DUF2461 family protein [Aestuariivivens insulae]